MCPAEIVPELPGSLQGHQSMASNFRHLRSVRWRIDLGVLPSSPSATIDDLRRVTADSRRRYAGLRKHLLIDPHVRKLGNDCLDLAVDNPLSQNPDSMWGRFFLNAELEQTVDKDLSRLYPEHENYFQTAGCQSMLRRILLLWCLRHPECGYRQGMHELLAPLLYVLHADIQHLNEIRKLYGDHFVDKFDEFHEDHDFDFKISSSSSEDDDRFQEQPKKHTNLSDLDANVQSTVLLSDPYGAEGELGIVLSERFMEHDVYCMFDALMSGAGGSVAMAVFFTHNSPASAPAQTGVAPVIEASLALYHLLSIVDSSLYSHLVELGVEPQYFALRWLRVLFGREFSLEHLLVIWDEIFSFDNSKPPNNNDPGVLNSPRGAFISAMAVSMMLHLRSSLLATEYVTTCLQRLLNFPEEVDLPKLIGKAKSLVSLAMEANVNSYSTPLIVDSSSSKPVSTKGHHSNSLSFDSSSPQTPLGVIPERYWEEKWRVMQEEEETKKKSSPNLPPPKKKGWTEKIKMKLSRTESDPCPSKRERRERNHKSSIRRSLLDDLARQLNADEDGEEIVGGGEKNESSSHNNPDYVESDLTVKDVVVERVSYIDKICAPSNAIDDLVQQLGTDEDTEQIVHDNGSDVVVKNVVVDRISYINKICSTRSEDHSPAFSEPASPTENDTEKSSTESSMSHDMMDGEHQNSYSFKSAIEEEEEPDLPISDGPNANDSGECSTGDVSSDAANPAGGSSSGPENAPKEPLKTISRELKALSGRFQWLFKFGRHNNVNPGEGSSDKRVHAEDAKSADGGSLQENKARLSADDANRNPLNVKVDGCDQNLASTLRNLGQSMLENIQVLESAFQQEKNQAGTIEHLSKHALVEKGQVTAIAALTELRKISNLLREM